MILLSGDSQDCCAPTVRWSSVVPPQAEPVLWKAGRADYFTISLLARRLRFTWMTPRFRGPVAATERREEETASPGEVGLN